MPTIELTEDFIFKALDKFEKEEMLVMLLHWKWQTDIMFIEGLIEKEENKDAES